MHLKIANAESALAEDKTAITALQMYQAQLETGLAYAEGQLASLKARRRSVRLVLALARLASPPPGLLRGRAGGEDRQNHADLITNTSSTLGSDDQAALVEQNRCRRPDSERPGGSTFGV
jgi:hypothetical protein